MSNQLVCNKIIQNHWWKYWQVELKRIIPKDKVRQGVFVSDCNQKCNLNTFLQTKQQHGGVKTPNLSHQLKFFLKMAFPSQGTLTSCRVYRELSKRIPLCCLMKLSVYRVNEQSQISLSPVGQKRGECFCFAPGPNGLLCGTFLGSLRFLINYDRFVSWMQKGIKLHYIL